MGLDMYAFRVKDAVDLPPVDAEFGENQVRKLAYWRKHPNLHGWMEQLYRSKGGKCDSFNCTTVEVLEVDLVNLEAAINGEALPETSGFFFGKSSPEDTGADRQFIDKARAAIAAGERVFYDSWW